MPTGILRRGRIARASPMGKVRSMRAFPINERAVNYRLCSYWNYVGRHGADRFSTAAPRRLSGGQSCDGRGVRADQFATVAPACNLRVAAIRLAVKSFGHHPTSKAAKCFSSQTKGIRSRFWCSANQGHFHTRK